MYEQVIEGRKYQQRIIERLAKDHLRELVNAGNSTTELELVQQKIVAQFLTLLEQAGENIK